MGSLKGGSHDSNTNVISQATHCSKLRIHNDDHACNIVHFTEHLWAPQHQKVYNKQNYFWSTSSDVTRNVLKPKIILLYQVIYYQTKVQSFKAKHKFLFSFFFLGSGQHYLLQTGLLRTDEIWLNKVNIMKHIILLENPLLETFLKPRSSILRMKKVFLIKIIYCIF